MLNKIKEFFSRIFPMSIRRLDDRLCLLEKNMMAAITEQNDMLNRLETKLAQTEEQQSKLADEVLEQIEQRQSTMAANVQDISSASTVLENLIKEIANEQYPKLKTRVEESFARQTELASALDEIQHGDLFRRIEFSQGKLVRLENILQKNMLTLESQRGSREYAFIMRMRSLFPLVDVEQEDKFIRIGREHDGGYVMFDDFAGRRIAYSFGIADDVSWDKDMASRGLDVYMYDHTIEALPEQNERFHYHRIGIGASGDSFDVQLKSLTELMNSNGHQNEYGMILKLDVEGAEWDVLCDLEQEVLKHFSQIVIEFHGLTNPQNEDKIRKAMEKLNATHHLVHIHANNFGSYLLLGGAILPDLLEATYLLKSECKVVGKSVNVSCEADSINCIYLPDIFLDGWTNDNADD